MPLALAARTGGVIGTAPHCFRRHGHADLR
jgi:hypothetical protein